MNLLLRTGIVPWLRCSPGALLNFARRNRAIGETAAPMSILRIYFRVLALLKPDEIKPVG